MKLCLYLLIIALGNSLALANPPISHDLTQTIAGTKAKYGTDRFRMVMPGTLYRGGSSGSKGPLSNSSLQALCKDGFKVAAYVYGSGWNHSNTTQLITCNKNEMSYLMRRWDHPREVHQLLEKLHHLITTEEGPMYVHCWYGVHASGYVATVALMQFCNLSPAQGVAYWNSNVPQKLQYTKVQNRIRNFKPDPALQLTSEQQARVCPTLG